MPADFARCESKHCPRKDTCLRFMSPPYWADCMQRYIFVLDVENCEQHVDLQ